MINNKETLEVPEWIPLPMKGVIADLINTAPWVSEAVIGHLHTARYVAKHEVIIVKPVEGQVDTGVENI